MLEQMPEPLFQEWEAYWRREPFGPPQEDLRLAYLTKMFHDVYRGGGAALKTWEFFPSLKAQEQPITANSFSLYLIALTAQMKGTTVEPRKGGT